MSDVNVLIVDTTLRDGEQTAGVAFTTEEKVQIAQMLDQIGVPEIEVGTPALGDCEAEAITAITSQNLNARLITWNRPIIRDIKDSIAYGITSVAISIPVSDIHLKFVLKKSHRWILERVKEATLYAKRNGLYVSVNAGDASRADLEFLVHFMRESKTAGADRIRYCDTVGLLDPLRTYEIVTRLIDEVGIDIEMHTHNDFGLATANAIAGVRAGAKYVNTTVNGLGERAGNACLAEVVMALKHIDGIDTGVDVSQLRTISQYVEIASRQPVSPNKPIVGSNIFSHESGIHTDGMIKHSSAYEAFTPEEVGEQRRFLIGKFSGSHAIRYKFREDLGIELPEDLVPEVLSRVRKLSVQLKRSLTDEELLFIYRSICKDIFPNSTNSDRINNLVYN